MALLRNPKQRPCDCGRVVHITDHWYNMCECGRGYSGSGQLLAPPKQWGEETGESFDDAGGYIHGSGDADDADDEFVSLIELSGSSALSDIVERPGFVANQSALPKGDRLATDVTKVCKAPFGQLACTKAKGHEGDHVAHNLLGTVSHRWRNELN